MRIAVIGAGAIGGLVAGYLEDKRVKTGTVPEGDCPCFSGVSLIGHPDAVRAIKKNGLQISGVRGSLDIKIDVLEKLTDKPDLVILAVKTQDVETVIKNNLEFLRDSIVLTTQNGVQADNLCAKYLPKENIISSIVMFGATSLEPGVVVHNFEGSWIIAEPFAKNDAKIVEVSRVLNQIFPTIVAQDLWGMKYLKIFVNANNCIPAILGLSMQEAFGDTQVAKISIGIWKEGLDIVNKAQINLVSLPDFPLERLNKLTSLPILEAAKIFSSIMANLSKEPLYGSILQSIKRGKVSEIDYINGEFVNLARGHNLTAPLNEKLVEMVHEVERTGKFFSKEELLNAVIASPEGAKQSR